MMILNLINTIAIALGIGTSVNNTNFNYEKKTHRNATNVTINRIINYGNTPAQSYKDNQNNKLFQKYYLDNKINPNYYNNYFHIKNSYYQKKEQNDVYQQVYGIYKIRNYFNSAIQVELDVRYDVTRTGSVNYGNFYADVTGIDLEQYYGMQLNASIDTQLNNLETDGTVNGWDYEYRGQFNPDNVADEYILGATTGLIRIEANSEIQLLFESYMYVGDGSQNISMKPKYIHITGEIIGYEQPEQEIVDIPAIMFTILTLPFSFISQAFNLTIFPNTPYEINFSNLFLTIIAIFILLWLIKHIFK